MKQIDQYLVFVYGTLRKGEINDLSVAAVRHAIPVPELVGQASVKGRLYDFGEYPGLVLGESTNAVWGDVYRVDAALLPVLDEIEEVYPDQSGLFQRCTIAVMLNQAMQACMVYPVAASAVQGLPQITEGDWIAYRKNRQEVSTKEKPSVSTA